jgi:hypothetical protein
VVQDFDFKGWRRVRGRILGVLPSDSLIVGALPGKKTNEEIVAELEHRNIREGPGLVLNLTPADGPYELVIAKPGEYTVFAVAYGSSDIPRIKSEQLDLRVDETRTLDFNVR